MRKKQSTSTRTSKKERLRRERIKAAWQRKKAKEEIRRQRISESLKAFHKTGKKKADRAATEKAAKVEKLPPLPEGFGRIDPRPEIQDMLHKSGEEMVRIHGIDHDVRHAVNADNSVSFELRFAVPKKFDPQIMFTDLASSLRSIPGTWISLGFRFRPSKMSPEEAESYDRYRGMTQIQAYTRRSTPGKIADLEATAEKILANVKERKGWVPETMFVRVHWKEEGFTSQERKAQQHRGTLKH
jgi:hypothetical protein